MTWEFSRRQGKLMIATSTQTLWLSPSRVRLPFPQKRYLRLRTQALVKTQLVQHCTTRKKMLQSTETTRLISSQARFRGSFLSRISLEKTICPVRRTQGQASMRRLKKTTRKTLTLRVRTPSSFRRFLTVKMPKSKTLRTLALGSMRKTTDQPHRIRAPCSVTAIVDQTLMLLLEIQ